MNKFILLTLVFTSYAFADLTEFSWNGAELKDENGTIVSSGTPNPNYTALTVFSDLTSFVSGGQINISALNAAIYHPTVETVDVSAAAGPFPGGQYLTSLFTSDGSIAGNSAYLLIHQGNGSIQVGDFIGFGTLGNYTINELDADGAGPTPRDFAQEFDGGNVITNITVIPEPTTIAVLLMGLLGLIGYRKHLRK